MVSTSSIIVSLIAFSGQVLDVEAFAGWCEKHKTTTSQNGHLLYRNINLKPVTVRSTSSSRGPALFAENQRDDETTSAAGNFWEQQKMLADSLTAEVRAEVQEIEDVQAQGYATRLNSLLVDNLYITSLIFSVLWGISYNPLVPLSFLFGALLGTAYSFGLGKYVSSIKSSEERLNAAYNPGEGLGQARFAFVFILLILLGKFRGETGLQEIPTIAGFFTYQLATLSQGFRDLDERPEAK